MFRSAPIVGGRRGTRIPNSLRVSVKTLFSAGPRLNAEPKPGLFASADPFRAEHVLKHCDDRPEPFDYLPEEGDQAVRGEFVISEDIPGRAVCIYVRGVQVVKDLRNGDSISVSPCVCLFHYSASQLVLQVFRSEKMYDCIDIKRTPVRKRILARFYVP